MKYKITVITYAKQSASEIMSDINPREDVVYTQVADDIDLKAVIEAVNGSHKTSQDAILRAAIGSGIEVPARQS